ncbi:Uncharacterised protein [Legionella beliardensis]|uniref:Uncharacterized protein n=1 Tax=Legionella beliardensis TaxID=91822 RepID=A0A378I1H0_9GAMM|nr:hypothetical protein [Legionella beliardensis]STX28525.1 Uncharacterised protein [Legionella beliardensis]
MARPVALLDIDDTLLIENELNTALLESLKDNHVNDIYLFTDMTFKSSSLEERLRLKKQLENSGFKVHGFITPLDLVWTKLDDKEARQEEGEQAYNFTEALYSPRFGAIKNLAGEALDSILDDEEIAEEFSAYRDALKNPRPLDQIRLGSAFEEALDVYNSDIADPKKEPGFHLSHNMNPRGDVAKLLGDQRAIHEGYSHTKGLLLEAFMANKPEWVSSIIIADDNRKVIESCEKYKAENNPDIPISTIHVDKKNTNTHNYNYYNNETKKHLSADPFPIIAQIDAEITQLKKSKRNFFLSSPERKIFALEKLKQDIINADLAQTNFLDVISNWENSIHFKSKKTNQGAPLSEIIAQQRNILKPEFSSKQTSTQKLITNLKEKLQISQQEFKEDVSDEDDSEISLNI